MRSCMQPVILYTFFSPWQIPVLSDPTTPQAGPVNLPEFQDVDVSHLSHVPEQALYENTNIKTEHTDSPDSGHKEMSSESLSYTIGQADTSPWYKMNGHNANNNLQNHIRCTNPFKSPEWCSPKTSSGGNNNIRHSQNQGQDVKMILPMPLQDACGNPLELNVTPRIDPPPKVCRNRPGEVATDASEANNNRCMYTAGSVTANNAYKAGVNATTNTDNCINERKELALDNFSLNVKPRSREDLLNNENKPLTTGEKPATAADMVSINDLSSGQCADSSPLVSPDYLSNKSDSTSSRLHISFSDEENTENSEDSGVPLHPRRLDSMTFDEFDALSS